MSYVGNTPADKFLTLEKQQFSVSATTGYTLSHSVSSPQDIALFINNVRQNPNSSYTVSGTALTLSSPGTSSGDTMYCVFLGKAIGTVAPAVGSVTNTMLAGSIATSKLADGSTFGQTNTPAFQASITSDIAISDNTATKVAANIEDLDTNGAYDNSSNYRFTVPSGHGGKYYCYGAVTLKGSSGNTVVAAQGVLYKNGSAVRGGVHSGDGGFDRTTCNFAAILTLDVGDYLELYGYCNVSTGTAKFLTFNGGTYFGAYKIIGA